MIWYTSDTHFLDESMLRYERMNDPAAPAFASVAERDAHIARLWNERVSDDDDVYIVGDVARSDRDGTARVLERLKGRKHIVLGNHDPRFFHSFVRRGIGGVVEVRDGVLSVLDGGRAVEMCHYPVFAWRNQHKGSFHVYGHLHATVEDGAYRDAGRAFARTIGMREFRAVNAGVMVNGYAPATLQEMCIRGNLGATWSDCVTDDGIE